jgi:hypothetical protein
VFSVARSTLANGHGIGGLETIMTQRDAVYVGCRLIAIFLMVEAIINACNTLLSIGFMFQQAPRGGFPMANLPMKTMVQSLIVTALVRGGVAIVLWVAAGRISRAAAPPMEADDDWTKE